jgi:diguanylate cyclase (GGDEF)-like protein
MESGILSRAPLEELKAAALAAGGATDHVGYLQEATEQLSRLIGSDHCSLLVLRGGKLYHGGAVGLPAFYTEALDDSPIGPNAGTCGAAAARGEPVITRDIHESPAWEQWRDLADEAGLRACWSVPLKLPAGDTLGTFATYHTDAHEPDPELVELARAHASLVALGLDRLRREERLSESYEAVVVALSSALDVRDEYTGAHSTETAALAMLVGRRMGLAGAELRELEQTAVLHDIGKLGVPTEILHAPRALTPDERRVMEQHPVIGEQILRAVPYLATVAKSVRHEHERWDGGGYPDGLAGEEIPLASRIVFVCDAWHAMTSDRPYRVALGVETAAAELRDNTGTQFDPAVVEAVLEVLAEGTEDPAPDPVAPQDAEEEARAGVLRSVAETVGAEDLFVFRKTDPARYSHFGGVGRGEGWAGNIELDCEADQLFVSALADGEARCVTFEDRGRVVGPYYAHTAMLVPCRNDVVVVFGSSTDALAGACTGEAAELAERAAAVIESVSPAKRLADELEVLEAVRAITAIGGATLEDALAQIADAAAAALSCEFGAVVLGDASAPRIGMSERGWSAGDRAAATELLMPFVTDRSALPLLVQDVRTAPSLSQRFKELGATAVHALPVGDPVVAVLVLVHADSTPRGFTHLCRRVARSVADAAEIVIRRSLAQEELALENARLSRRVLTDALTGVASRTAWEEALRREEAHRSRSGAGSTVAVFDVNGLKQVNDRLGHPAGDHLLRSCARVLADSARGTDLVARIGGDEFAVLLRYTDEEGGAAWCQAVLDALAESAPDASMAAGWCSSQGVTLAEAFTEADHRMLGAKTDTR